MNHYAKLTTAGTRLVAAIIFLLGLMGVVYFLIAGLLGPHTGPDLLARLFSSVIFLFTGVGVFLLSKIIGRVLAWGIES